MHFCRHSRMGRVCTVARQHDIETAVETAGWWSCSCFARRASLMLFVCGPHGRCHVALLSKRAALQSRLGCANRLEVVVVSVQSEQSVSRCASHVGKLARGVVRPLVLGLGPHAFVVLAHLLLGRRRLHIQRLDAMPVSRPTQRRGSHGSHGSHVRAGSSNFRETVGQGTYMAGASGAGGLRAGHTIVET